MLDFAKGKQCREYFAVALAVIHLAIVGFSAFALEPENSDDRPLQSQAGIAKMVVEAIRFYASWSGTDTAYNFFAPGVLQAPRARFRILHTSGDVSERILRVDQFEIRLRVASLARSALKTQAPYAFARSLAVMVFDQEKEADLVTVIFEEPIFPDFREALEGQYTIWRPAYSADFVKNGKELICLC